MGWSEGKAAFMIFQAAKPNESTHVIVVVAFSCLILKE